MAKLRKEKVLYKIALKVATKSKNCEAWLLKTGKMGGRMYLFFQNSVVDFWMVGITNLRKVQTQRRKGSICLKEYTQLRDWSCKSCEAAFWRCWVICTFCMM